MACESNLARNRQTRMLADLTLVGCYNTTAMSQEQRDRIMLESAKQNLLNMSFFGLTEFQNETKHLFERTFNLTFQEDSFKQKTNTSASLVLHHDLGVTEGELARVREINRLDIELYAYAQVLFKQRLHYLRLNL